VVNNDEDEYNKYNTLTII